MQYLSDLEKSVFKQLYEAHLKKINVPNVVALCKSICNEGNRIYDACGTLEYFGYLEFDPNSSVQADTVRNEKRIWGFRVQLTEHGIETIEREAE